MSNNGMVWFLKVFYFFQYFLQTFSVYLLTSETKFPQLHEAGGTLAAILEKQNLKMKYILLSISFFLLLSCQNSKDKTKLDSSKIKDINEIVETIIIEDSLEVLKKDNKSIMLCDSLKKSDIYVASKKDKELGVPPPPGFVTLNRIIKTKIKNQVFFSSKDSSHIISQYTDIEKLKISDEILNKVNSTSFEKEITKRKKGKEYHFYEIGIPLFSKDNKKAFVELGHFCGSTCGHGEAIFLEKINGRWRIIERFETWMS